ncbi:hypothetical protein EDC14_1001202 [Hydrogenispora ethanolica]|jgi:hypothetical protein|uniref:Uncharacterized protein n=1 Tax=Hydrogenispora ethanolica TaxID=1082276 RepID=A0A4V2QGR8_HYDET|nr:hypothetical protein [Hydrogenispora ethanolica]TCL76917.1 hypothetical protein EDC14_1001202 [Hydrogenispora ethanolica]
MNWRAVLHDKILMGAGAGLVADLLQDRLQSVMKKQGWIRLTLDQLAGSLFIRDVSLLDSPLAELVSTFSGVIFSMILGILFVYLLDRLGFRYVVFKGVLFGAVLWFAVYGGLCAALGIPHLQDHQPLHALVQLLGHLVFGLLLGGIVAWYNRALWKVP